MPESATKAGIAVTLVIPVVAFLLVRLIRRVGRRYANLPLDDSDEDLSYRRRRLKTISRTATGVFSVVIWITTLVYVFARLGLDVTPIVASASVRSVSTRPGTPIKRMFLMTGGDFLLL